MRKFYLVLVSNLLGIIIVYILYFIYFFSNFNNEFTYSFKSLENLDFHEKYSKKIHHIREETVLNLLFKKPKVEDLLFSTINELEGKKKIVLIQGDSWMEQLTSMSDQNFISLNLVKKFGDKKKIGFINAGTSSYSPTLMNLQLDVLQEDFQIFPVIVIAYIDQTDIGDEICRYKNNKIYKNGILKSVQPEAHLMYKDLFSYSQIYGLSRIYLNDNSKITKTFQLINFKFKYQLTKSTIRFYRKHISRSKADKDRLNKCYWGEIEKYLIKPSELDIKYFTNSLKDYVKKINQKKHIKKLIFVTFPHKKHFYTNSNQTSSYTLNVSDVVDNVIKDKKNIAHINFSKMLFNEKNFNYKNIWDKDNIHLNSYFHGNLFFQKILDELLKYENLVP